MASISSVKTEDLETECVPKVASIKVFVEQQWYKATEMLQSNPNLMTGGIFSLALKHRPPVHIVQFMLQLNPKAASIPDIGPTPLQIAVKHGCSAAVVRTVVEACPFALVETNSSSFLHPLQYAKRFRSDEKDIIEILSTPLSKWLTNYPTMTPPPPPPLRPPSSVPLTRQRVQVSATPLGSPHVIAESPETKPKPKCDIVDCVQKVAAIPSTGLSEEDRSEINNCKYLCLQVLKSHKKLMQALKEETNMEGVKEDHMRQLENQRIALDMKEQHVLKKLKRLTQRIVVKQQDMANTSRQECLDAMEVVERQLRSFQKRLSLLESHAALAVAAKASSPYARYDPVVECKSKLVHETPVVFSSPYIQECKTNDSDDHSLLSDMIVPPRRPTSCLGSLLSFHHKNS